MMDLYFIIPWCFSSKKDEEFKYSDVVSVHRGDIIRNNIISALSKWHGNNDNMMKIVYVLPSLLLYIMYIDFI